jgi:hypothetical protein
VTSSSVGSQLARSLVRSLGDDCGVAASLAQFALSHPGDLVAPQDFAFGGSPGVAARVAGDFVSRGWLVQGAMGWRAPAKGTLPEDLASFLDGAAAMRSANPTDSSAAAVVTMPPLPSAVGRALPAIGIAHAGLIPTSEAFERVADAASVSLTVMTPFVNEEGLRWALQILRRTRAPQRRLVVRAVPECSRTIRECREEIQSAGVEVLNYSLRISDGPYYETFHAKVVLADASLAYVGSANFLAYARHSMELGILADGRAAHVIASVVRAVEAVSDRVPL